MSHAETIFIVNGPQSKRRRINGARTLRKVLLVDPYVNDLRSSFSTLAMLNSSPSAME